MDQFNQLIQTAHCADFSVYGRDFLCRTLAILYCFGGGPGGEYFRTGVAYHVALLAQEALEEAVKNMDWDTINLFRTYVSDIQNQKACWLNRTLDRLNIPLEIENRECVL